MDPLQQLKSRIPAIEKKLGVHMASPDLLALAFIHPSFVNENKHLINDDNQRLEFLGDSVLNLVIADWLYKRFPERPEGELSELRSVLVDSRACTQYLSQLGVSDYFLLSRGEQLQMERGLKSIMADVLEAIIGALYLDGGIEKARSFFFTHFEPSMVGLVTNPPRNWKAELQDYCQRTFGSVPNYTVIKEEGPDHAKIFCVQVKADDKIKAIGIGPSKKIAQQEAARDAVEKIERG